MFTTGSKLFFGAAVVAVVSAFLYSNAVDDTRALLLLGSVGFVLAFFGGVVFAFRDADLDVPAVVSSSPSDAEGTPVGAPRPVAGSMWPIVGGFGAAITAIGLVLDTRMFVLGLIVIIATLIEWMFQNWAETASGDENYNRSVRGRLAHGLEFPVLAALIFGVVILGFSRVMLALPRIGSVVAFAGVGVVILIGAVLISSSGRARRSLTSGLLTVGAVAVVAAGVVFAAVGPRHIEEGGEKPDANSRTVAAKSNVFARLVLSDGQLNESQLVLSKGVTASILFRNEDDGDRKLVVESFTESKDADGNTVQTPKLIESGNAGKGHSQYLTLSLPKPGTYDFRVEGGSAPVTGTIVVP
jgi:Cupredoxin-like domain